MKLKINAINLKSKKSTMKGAGSCYNCATLKSKQDKCQLGLHYSVLGLVAYH